MSLFFEFDEDMFFNLQKCLFRCVRVSFQRFMDFLKDFPNSLRRNLTIHWFTLMNNLKSNFIYLILALQFGLHQGVLFMRSAHHTQCATVITWQALLYLWMYMALMYVEHVERWLLTFYFHQKMLLRLLCMLLTTYHGLIRETRVLLQTWKSTWYWLS